ncbi:hypothetical protein D3C84_365670 [compost metagenome]
MQQYQPDIEQQIDPGQFPGRRVIAVQRRHIAFQGDGQLQHPAGQHRRATKHWQEQGVEQQPAALAHDGPAAFGVGNRLSVSQVNERPCVAGVEVLSEIPGGQRLCQGTRYFFGAGVLSQLRRLRFFPTDGVVAQAETKDVGAVEPVIAVDRPGPVRQPAQYAVLQGAGLCNGVEQCFTTGELLQGVLVYGPIQDMRTDAGVPRLNDEHVVDDIGGRAGLAGKGKRADDDVLAVDDALGGLGVQDGLDKSVALEAQSVLAADRVFQRLKWQLYLERLAKPDFPTLRFAVVIEQQGFEGVRVTFADVHPTDQPFGAAEQTFFTQDVVGGQPRRDGFTGLVCDGHAARGRGAEVLDGQFGQRHGDAGDEAAAQITGRHPEIEQQIARFAIGIGMVQAHLITQGIVGEIMQVFDAVEEGLAACQSLPLRLLDQPLTIFGTLAVAGVLEPLGQGRAYLFDRLLVRRRGMAEVRGRVGTGREAFFQCANTLVGGKLDGVQVLQLTLQQQRGLSIEDIAIGFRTLDDDFVGDELALHLTPPGLIERFHVRVRLQTA